MERFNYGKLRGRIKEQYSNESNFAEKLGMSRVSLSKRLNCRLDFSSREMLRISEMLGINHKEIPTYFFAPVVQEIEQPGEVS